MNADIANSKKVWIAGSPQKSADLCLGVAVRDRNVRNIRKAVFIEPLRVQLTLSLAFVVQYTSLHGSFFYVVQMILPIFKQMAVVESRS